jgi:hypothetical protein
MPTLTTTGQEIYDAIAPLMESDQPGRSDADNGYVGAILSGAFATMVAAPDVATKKAIIKTPLNFTRGRPSTIVAAAQNTLTGAKTVLLNKFLGGNSNALGITTITSQTPNPTATINAIMAVMPAWIVPTISVVTGGDYATLAASHSSYSLMEAAHTHYSDIPTNPAA